jgi:aspartate aminotransferase
VQEKTDVSFYDRNRKTLYEGLAELGFSAILPEGAFYLWMKSPYPDEKKFVEMAKKHRLLLVPGSTFGCSGYVRIAYCVSHDMILRSMDSFRELAKEVGCYA